MSETMSLAELQVETLVQKNRRLVQERCPHEEIYSSTVLSDGESFTNRACLDCGKTWHTEPRT